MRRVVGAVVVVAAAGLVTTAALRAAADLPAWAYAIAPPRPAGAPAPAPEPAEDTTALHRLPGSTRSFSIAQITDLTSPADWFPEDHPEMPSIVAHGRQPAVRACSYCHYPNGKGRPSNGPVSGQPVAYFLQALADFRDGLRKPADSRKNNVNQMIAFAKAMTPEEMRAAAEYFGSIKWTPWIRVVETEMVPKTRAAGFIFFKAPGSEMEPIGMRIVETPEDDEQTEPLRNPRSGFVAYVPIGSLQKGEALVKTGGNGRTLGCAICHGPDLNGAGSVPAIAGRSPSYLARQMYDYQAGTRNGPGAALMKPVVEQLTDEDYVSITAYVASLRP